MGCGRVGSTLARSLEDRNHTVSIIDSNPDAFRRLGPTFSGTKVTGVGFDQDVLERAGIDRADAFAAAMTFARTEGLIPAPEPTHALRAVVEEAEAAKEAGEERVILFGLCGHGHFDLAAYDAYLRGELEDPEFDEADARRAIDALPDGVPLLA